MNNKNTSSNEKGKSSVSDNNMSNKNVTHTQNLPPKTKSNSVSNGFTNYKYNPEVDNPNPKAMNKAPSSGNIRGV